MRERSRQRILVQHLHLLVLSVDDVTLVDKSGKQAFFAVKLND